MSAAVKRGLSLMPSAVEKEADAGPGGSRTSSLPVVDGVGRVAKEGLIGRVAKNRVTQILQPVAGPVIQL